MGAQNLTMGGGATPYKIPHWSKYKVSDRTPELQEVERRLAALGLKDPWIRNEVWRYDKGLGSLGFWTKWRMLLFSAAISIYWEKEWSKKHAAHAPHGEH